MRPVLDEFIHSSEFFRLEGAFNFLLTCRRFELYLPTEASVNEPRLVMPNIARAYPTDFYVHNGKVLNYSELMDSEPKFRGTSNYPNVVLFEYYEDLGSDGHIHYEHIGYMFCCQINIDDRKYPEDELQTRYTYNFMRRKES